MQQLLEKYYDVYDPDQRKMILDEMISTKEESEKNEIRQKLWELRYAESSSVADVTRADGFLGLWMTMEFNRGAANKLFGGRGAKKEIQKKMEQLKFFEYANGSNDEREMLYMECYHLVKTYIRLCREDRSYNTFLSGVISLKKDTVNKKIRTDIYETAVELPNFLNIAELSLITRAAREAFAKEYPEQERI